MFSNTRREISCVCTAMSSSKLKTKLEVHDLKISRSSPVSFHEKAETSRKVTNLGYFSWGGSRGGSGGSVEPPKLNVKTYNKRVVKKKSEPTQLINISFENDISLCLCTRKQQ